MIVSHRHRFIYVKLLKTAGTSIEVQLARSCGPDDVVTPVNPPVEDHQPRNDEGYFNHMNARRIREALGAETWGSYYKFTFERNPWDKMVSFYWWVLNEGHRFRGFKDFVQQCAATRRFPRDFPSDIGSYKIDDALAVDFVGRFENLQEDLGVVAERCGFALIGALPQAKGALRKAERHYSSYYDDETRDLVAEAFAGEIALLGYKFEAVSEAASGDADITPPNSRNALCPCGSGQRYKHCHGKLS